MHHLATRLYQKQKHPRHHKIYSRSSGQGDRGGNASCGLDVSDAKKTQRCVAPPLRAPLFLPCLPPRPWESGTESRPRGSAHWVQEPDFSKLCCTSNNSALQGQERVAGQAHQKGEGDCQTVRLWFSPGHPSSRPTDDSKPGLLTRNSPRQQQQSHLPVEALGALRRFRLSRLTQRSKLGRRGGSHDEQGPDALGAEGAEA